MFHRLSCLLLVLAAALALAAAPVPSAAVLVLERQASPPVPAGGPDAFAGVARLANGCSGVLLRGGRHALGAAHCAASVGQEILWTAAPAPQAANPPPARTADALVAARVAVVTLAPGWQGQAGQNDLVLYTLDRPVREVPGYRIAAMAEIRAAAWVWVAGWGAGGTPGATEPAGLLRFGRNEYDAWLPSATTDTPAVALFDFDDGSFGRNSLGLAPGGVSSLGLGPDEAMLAGQDSGGPSFIEWRKADNQKPGLAARIDQWLGRKAPGAADDEASELLIAGIHAGVQSRTGSRPGGVALDTLLGAHAAWISSIAGPQVLAPGQAGPSP